MKLRLKFSLCMPWGYVWGGGGGAGGGRCVSPLILGFFIVDGVEYEEDCTYNL